MTAASRWAIGLLLAALLSALPAWATNLQEAFDAAQRQDPTVQAARLQVDIDNQQRKAARSRLRPTIGAELSTTNGQLHTNLFARHHYDNRLAGISLNIPVYSPQDTARLQQAQVSELLAQSRLAQALQNLAEQVAASYFAVLSAQDAVDVAEAQRNAIQEQFAAAREGFSTGNATITDQQEAQARLDLNRAQLAAARHALQGRQATFTQLTGLPADRLQRLPPDTRLPPTPAQSQTYWEDQARTRSFLVRQAEMGVQGARHGVEVARAGHYPTVTIGAQVGSLIGQTNITADSQIHRTRDISGGVQVKIPLYAGGGLVAQERASVATLEQRESQLEAARRGAAQQVRDLYLALQSNMEQADALQAAVRSSQLALEANHVGYRAGVRVNIDVLNAQQQLFQARQNLASTRYAVLLNQLRLKAAIGALDDADIAAVDGYLKAPAGSNTATVPMSPGSGQPVKARRPAAR